VSPRLNLTLAELTKRLEPDIARGDISIQRGRDRLTITLVERVLFDSGQAQIKPSGVGVLKQVSEILKSQPDKQVRVEGHTDNVPIGAKLKERFPTNWELSTARATSVVRYLLEEGGLDPGNLSAVGFADTRPIASNDVEEGRMANRRIDIVLYPKELAEASR
jgi:chemotaxis protein MotB